MKLYSYFRSSAAYRVRIALNLKNIDHEIIGVNLLKSEQHDAQYLDVNPQGLLPAMAFEHGNLGQSLAILEYLDAEYPEVPLLTGDHWHQARIRSLAYAIACDIHPLNNLRVLKHLSDELNVSDEDKNAWYRHWVEEGFNKVEQLIGNGDFCVGNEPTLADVCLIPQVFNALRFNIDMNKYPKINRVYQRCNQMSEFKDAAPENQPDAT